MTPQNEAALIVLACQDLDELMKKKYTFIGGSIATVVFLISVSVLSLFFNVDWFILSFCCPFLVWYLSEQYVAKLNTKIRSILQFIQYHHQHEMLRRINSGVELRSEV